MSISPRHKPKGFLLAPSIVAIVVFCGSTAGFLFYNNTHVYRENYAATNPKMAAMVSETEGWLPGDDALAVARGTSALIVYDFYKAADHAVSLEVTTGGCKGLAVEPVLFVQNRKETLGTLRENQTARFDLTPFLDGHAGVFRLRLDAALSANAPAPSCHPLKGFTLTLSRPRRIHYAALLFFALLAGLLYGAVVAVAIGAVRFLKTIYRPSGRSSENGAMGLEGAPLSEVSSGGSDGDGTLSFLARALRSGLALVLALAIGFALIASAPGWRERKKFDDVRAISNAAALLDNGFDVNSLYFRGRTRPGFIAWAAPLVRLYRQTILRVQKTPADFYRRVWEEFDRDNGTYTQCVQPALSVYGLALAGLSLLFLAGIAARLGLGRAGLPIVVFAAAVFFRRTLEIPITQTFVFFINLGAIAAWFQWRAMANRASRTQDEPCKATLANAGEEAIADPSDQAAGQTNAGVAPWTRRVWLLIAAFLMGMAVLTKSATITSIVPIGLFQLVLLLDRRRGLATRKADLGAFLFYWAAAAAVVLVWYQGFLNGMISEYANFWKEVEAVQGLQNYESTSLAGIGGAFLSVFGWAGLALTALGLGAALTRRVRLSLFVFLWILGATTVFRMPYIFPRFFQYFIPPFSILAAQGIAWFIDRNRTQATGNGYGSEGKA